jgi:hypothetical protein
MTVKLPNYCHLLSVKEIEDGCLKMIKILSYCLIDCKIAKILSPLFLFVFATVASRYWRFVFKRKSFFKNFVYAKVSLLEVLSLNRFSDNFSTTSDNNLTFLSWQFFSDIQPLVWVDWLDVPIYKIRWSIATLHTTTKFQSFSSTEIATTF